MCSLTVRAIHGIHHGFFEGFAGRKVRQIQGCLSTIFNIRNNSAAFVNGERVSLEYELRSGDTLEFVYPYGMKGINPVHTVASIKSEYRLPDHLCHQLVKDLRPIGTNDEGMNLYAEHSIDEWLDRLSGRNDRETIVAMAEDLRRMADKLAPPLQDKVGTPYIAAKLACTTVWITELIRSGQIPADCIVQGTGNGKLWKFHKQKIDRWIKER